METIKGNALTIVNYLMQVPDKTSVKYELSEIKKKRSLTQNAYAWELIGKIGDATRLSKEEVYEQLLWSYGKSLIIPLRADINPSGWFKYYKEYSKTTDKNNVAYTYYKVAKGSSEFTQEEMAIFIDGIIQECEQLDIETMTPDEIARLKL